MNAWFSNAMRRKLKSATSMSNLAKLQTRISTPSRRFFIFPRIPRKYRAVVRNNSQALEWWQSDASVPGRYKRMIDEALRTDKVYTQQMNLGAEISGLFGSRERPTYACFLAPNAHQEELGLRLKMAIIGNPFCAELFNRSSVLIDMRDIGASDPRVKIYCLDGGHLESLRISSEVAQTPGLYGGNFSFAELISRNILNQARAELDCVQSERRASREAMASAQKSKFFRQDREDLGGAFFGYIQQQSLKCSLFLRGMLDPRSAAQFLIDKLVQKQPPDLLEKLRALSITRRGHDVVIRLDLNDPRKAGLITAIRYMVDDLHTVQIVSDLHLGDGGHHDDFHCAPGRAFRLEKKIGHAAARGYIWDFAGDTFEMWKFFSRDIFNAEENQGIWHEIRKLRKPCFQPGNHDYPMDSHPEVRRDMELTLGSHLAIANQLRLPDHRALIYHGHIGDRFNYGLGMFDGHHNLQTCAELARDYVCVPPSWWEHLGLSLATTPFVLKREVGIYFQEAVRRTLDYTDYLNYFRGFKEVPDLKNIFFGHTHTDVGVIQQNILLRALGEEMDFEFPRLNQTSCWVHKPSFSVRPHSFLNAAAGAAVQSPSAIKFRQFSKKMANRIETTQGNERVTTIMPNGCVRIDE